MLISSSPRVIININTLFFSNAVPGRLKRNERCSAGQLRELPNLNLKDYVSFQLGTAYISFGVTVSLYECGFRIMFYRVYYFVFVFMD
jgi:hypothetical protein